MRPRVVLAINAAWNIANFRAGLVRGLQLAGWEVIAVAPADEHVRRVEALGCRFVPVRLSASGINPLQDLALKREYRALLLRERPAAFLGFTIKPNVYGSLAAQELGIPVINNIAGLGTAFIRRNWLTWVARALYKRSLRRSHRVLFQNPDDQRYFVETGLARPEQALRIPGSGVDLSRFAFRELPPEDGGPLRILFVGRLLRDKGVLELVQAARLLRAQRQIVRIQLLGFCDSDNPSAVTLAQVQAWQAEGLVEYLGSTDDVRPWLEQAHAVVLPSYREGVPRTLLEAASMGRPLIATDAVGCREPVAPGVNGLLVRPADAADLARGLGEFLTLPAATRAAWGRASRAKAEAEFDERLVVQTYVDLLQGLQPASAHPAR
jgi:glycosyltransferase involved in cell wall biosynthesis